MARDFFSGWGFTLGALDLPTVASRASCRGPDLLVFNYAELRASIHWLGADLCGQRFLLWLGLRARSSGSSHCELPGLLVVGQPTRLQLLLSWVTIHYGLEQLWPGIPRLVVRSAFFHYASSCSFNVLALLGKCLGPV